MELRKRILMLSWEYPPNIVGGLARHVHGLSEELAKRDFEIHIITTQIEGLTPYEQCESIHIHRVKPYHEHDPNFITWVAGLNIAIFEKATELARQKSFIFVHAHDWLVGAAAQSIKAALHIPLITTIHATEHGRKNGIFTELQNFIHEKERSLTSDSDHIIVCSEYMKKEVSHLFGVENKQLTVIPNGIDTMDINDINRKILEKFPVDLSRRMIFSIGRMVYEKGFDTLIDAAAMLRETYPDVYFIIAGKGPLLEEYRLKVRKLSLNNHVYFVGFVTDDERNALYHQSRITVFPSRYEPFGIVALEGMAFGKPTIVSNVGGLKSIVKHMETGMLMEYNNPQSFIEQASFLLENDALAHRIGTAGKKAVQAQFGWNHIAEETVSVYHDLIQSNGKLQNITF
ncbi:glycosyltransferase family 4 protein [Bacillus dakarensis]|uniref:glycosyltransferase family 4 protein n=1 Tax=Robertmurraya dakarensis TaxID=1926278 RepID=UPI001F3AEB31|nr:glycosyltransferase family 4 protein [Bacillus dakarensis]